MGKPKVATRSSMSGPSLIPFSFAFLLLITLHITLQWALLTLFGKGDSFFLSEFSAVKTVPSVHPVLAGYLKELEKRKAYGERRLSAIRRMELKNAGVRVQLELD